MQGNNITAVTDVFAGLSSGHLLLLCLTRINKTMTAFAVEALKLVIMPFSWFMWEC